MAKRKYHPNRLITDRSPHSRSRSLLSLPSPGGLWEKNDTHWNYEVAISEFSIEPPNTPRVKFYPIVGADWISWEELHKNYRYIGKAMQLGDPTVDPSILTHVKLSDREEHDECS